MTLIYKWIMHEAKWHEFWMPQSGVLGGIMTGIIINIIIIGAFL